MVGVAVLGLGDETVDEIGGGAGDEHHDAHHENPHKQLNLHGGIFHRQQNKGDQCDPGYAIGFKTIGTRAHRVAGVIARAVRNDAGVARVVFLDFEDDLHEVGADVGNLRKDAASDAQGRRA